jgi:predicted secreted protein
MLVRKSSLILLALFVAGAALWAGDVASFVDLGFSEHGQFYSFGQYGVDEHTLKPWADLNIIDVPSNDFVPSGRILYKHDQKISVGQDGSGALMSLISKNSLVIQKYRANFMQQGIPLFISLKDIRNPDGDSIDFRDFEKSVHYQADLVSVVLGSGGNVRSSFYIKLTRTDNRGVKKVYRVGSPEVKRPGVTSYAIKKVIVNPERTSMILIIEMSILNGSGPDIRYMVEALKF